MASEFVPGSRPDSRDTKLNVKWELDSIRPKPGTGDLLFKLTKASMETSPNCEGRATEFTGYDLEDSHIPTDEEALKMCAGCPLLKLCDDYATKARPFGVWAGKRYGDSII